MDVPLEQMTNEEQMTKYPLSVEDIEKIKLVEGGSNMPNERTLEARARRAARRVGLMAMKSRERHLHEQSRRLHADRPVP